MTKTSTYIKAKLISLNKISVMMFSNIIYKEGLTFSIFKDGILLERNKPTKQVSQTNLHIFELTLKQDYEFGHEYSIEVCGIGLADVDVTNATEFDCFDDLFTYDGEDLGVNYSKKETNFALWAPLASKVLLKLEENDGSFKYLEMNRTDKGVFRISIKKDLKNKKYLYLVTNSNVSKETLDPYGKGVSLNSKYNVVIDLKELDEIKKVIPENETNNYVESIIYEVNVRDFTEDKNSNVINKGKYLGLVEENKTTKKGHPVALDYLKYLGITHIQLQPIHDFHGVDDIEVSKSYNWGYDPISYFALEGSYSTNPNDPIARLKEFKQMVSCLHKANIKVNIDVVYNHIYEYATSSLEKTVPNYYFRRTKANAVANASGCGNDIKSERNMVRKLIIDSLLYLVKEFDVDGFRFDLMGLLDIETINLAYKKIKQIKPNIMMYGEGWNMGIELPIEKKACIENSYKLENIAFFNDSYRNVLAGSPFKDRLYEVGYLGGNTTNLSALDFVIRGSINSIDQYQARFINANQSINYVECHDNVTIFDKLKACNPNEEDETILKRVDLANKLLLLSFGVPFIHMGQEIGQSKNGLDNTYNTPIINNFDFSKLDERFEMVNNLKGYIELRKALKLYDLSQKEEVLSTFNVDYWHNKVYCLELVNKKYLKDYPKLLILVNNENIDKEFNLEDTYTYLLPNGKQIDSISIKQGSTPGLTASILVKKGAI